MLRKLVNLFFLCAVIVLPLSLHAKASGVAFCEFEHTESQQHTLKLLQATYQADSCEALFDIMQDRRGVLFKGEAWRNAGQPMTDLTPICAMEHLKVINLNNVAIQDISCVSNMNLEQFNFHNDSSIELDISSLGENTDLELLILYGSPVKDFSPLSKLVNLEFLDMGWRNMKDTSPLASLKKLEVLKLNGNPLENLDGLSQLTELLQLELREANLTNQNLDSLQSLRKLEFLNISNNQLTDISSLSNLTQLRQLDIKENNIVDLSPLRNMHKLKYLDAKYNQIENVEPISELSSLSNIEIDDNNIKDTSSLARLPNLVILNALDNPLYDCAPKYKWDINAGKLCAEEDIEKLSNPSLWKRVKNLFH